MPFVMIGDVRVVARINSVKMLLIMLLFVGLAISGCGKGGGGNGFKVQGTSPVNGASGIDKNAAITVGFNGFVDPASVKYGMVILKDCIGNEFDGVISTNNDTLTFYPKTKLGVLRKYTVII